MIVKQMRTLPPSGTIAGIYAAVDSSRGVWKAPANVSINSIVGPSVKLDSKDQEDLNVSTTGKSINAIRAFTGKGTLVWGEGPRRQRQRVALRAGATVFHHG